MHLAKDPAVFKSQGGAPLQTLEWQLINGQLILGRFEVCLKTKHCFWLQLPLRIQFLFFVIN